MATLLRRPLSTCLASSLAFARTIVRIQALAEPRQEPERNRARGKDAKRIRH